MGPVDLANLFVLLLSLDSEARKKQYLKEEPSYLDMLSKLRNQVLSEGTPGIFAASISGVTRNIFAIVAIRQFTGLGLKETKEVTEGCRILLTTREAADALVKHMRLALGDTVKVEIEERNELGDLAGKYHCP